MVVIILVVEGEGGVGGRVETNGNTVCAVNQAIVKSSGGKTANQMAERRERENGCRDKTSTESGRLFAPVVPEPRVDGAPSHSSSSSSAPSDRCLAL